MELRALTEAIGRLAQNLYLAVATPAPYAALSSLTDENIGILEARRRTMQERRDCLDAKRQRLGSRTQVAPGGALHVYSDLHAPYESSHAS